MGGVDVAVNVKHGGKWGYGKRMGGRWLLLCFDTFRILVRERVRERWERGERREGGKGREGRERTCEY